MQVWETLYKDMFNLFVSHKTPLPEDIRPGVKAQLISCNDKCTESCTLDEYVHVTGCTESECSEVCSGCFLFDLASKDDNFKLWIYFLLHDCQAYVGLYTAIHDSMWALRMCPLFTAFDRLR